MKQRLLFPGPAPIRLDWIKSSSWILGAAAFTFLSALPLQAAVVPISSISGFGGISPNNDYNELTSGDFGAAGNLVQFYGAGSTQVGGAGKTSFVTLDLGTVQSLDRLRVIGRNSSGISNLSQATVQVSLDNTTWTTVRTMDYRAETTLPSANKSGNAYLLGFPTQTARYVRINLTNPDSAFREQISQFQVYNGGGPRVSLVDHGANLNQSVTGLTDKYPSLLVDGISNSSTNFVLYNGASGDFTLRLDSPEYSDGWDKISLWGRGTGTPSNPAEVTIYAGDSLTSMVAIHSESFTGTTSDWNFLLDMGATHFEPYLKVEWTGGSFTPANVQFKEVDVLPVPEPGILGLSVMAAGVIGIGIVRRQRAILQG